MYFEQRTHRHTQGPNKIFVKIEDKRQIVHENELIMPLMPLTRPYA